jgi:ABC-2 type transport system permease protein
MTFAKALMFGISENYRSIRATFKKEWLQWRSDKRIVWLVVAYLFLTLTALGFAFSENARFIRERHAAEVADRALWVNQQAKNPHAAAHFGQYAFKPINPLALADPGVNAFTGAAVWLEAHKQNPTQFLQARDGGVSARMGGLAHSFVLQTISPLFVILVGFSAFSGERETGILRLLMASAARPESLLFGKAFALLALMFLLSIPGWALLIFGVCFWSDPNVFPLYDQLERLGGLMLINGVYLGGFVFFVLGVSALMKSSRGTLIALASFWLVSSFIVPKLMSEYVSRVEPIPSLQEFRDDIAAEKAKRSFGHDETHPAFVAFRDEVLRTYQVAKIEDLPVSFRGLSLRRDDEIGFEIFDRHFGGLNDAFMRQDVLRSLPGFIFPILAIHPLSMWLSGTDSQAHYVFASEAEAHRRLIQNAVSENLIRYSRNGDKNYVASTDLWGQIPSFKYQYKPLQFGSELGILVRLFIWLILTVWFSIACVRNMNPA